MKRKPAKAGRRKKGRSADQRQCSDAMARASRVWESLSEAQRLDWIIEASNRRMSGQRYCTGVNLRRILNGQEPLTTPPRPAPPDPRPGLKRLLIANRGGRLTLQVEIARVPTRPVTIWASRPCNCGLGVCDKCPRLGPLPPPIGGVCDFTELYFRKHGGYIKKHGVKLVGKRIFVRIRLEADEGPRLYEEVKAVVPAPEKSAKPAKNR